MPKNLCEREQTYKALSAASPREMYQAMRMASRWLAGQLKGRTATGPFSEGYLGEPARQFFPHRACRKLMDPDCEWKWKQGTKLSTLFINVIRSDMEHIRRRYVEDGCPEVVPASRFETSLNDEDGDANSILDIAPELRREGFCCQSELEKQEEQQALEQRRDQGRVIAYRVACQSEDPQLIRYALLAFELPDYRSIALRMKMNQREVKQLESRLIELIKKDKLNNNRQKQMDDEKF